MTDLPAVKPAAILSGSSASATLTDYSEGMSYLQNLPRRLVTIYLPLTIIVVDPPVPVLLDGADCHQT